MNPPVGALAVAPALCGAAFGAGIYLLGRHLRRTRDAARDDRSEDRLLPHSYRVYRLAVGLDSATERVLGRSRSRRLLLTDELAILGRDPALHTATRMLRLLVASGTATALVVVLTAAGVSLPGLLLPAACLLCGVLGFLSADLPVHRRVAARRREVRAAVAAYLDLVRILLVGGAPLYSALRTAAGAGQGWAFGAISSSLDWARSHGLPPDAGLALLAARVPLAEFTDLRLTVGSALRGASPVIALRSKAVHLRATEAAQVRLETSTADAAMELPAAVVALAFVAFLTHPLLAVLMSVETPL
ncbi:secretion system protein [Frankia sp. CcI49]|uniref:secretion system protein n=1 Tax=Frankia sp. CcI49 TaxID=1745382 RepID=UPI0009770F0B|nr:secretion system protein [Frankia sp. CcI49]ONH60462.1 secretion system protein [Frankia sp. CcI49]